MKGLRYTFSRPLTQTEWDILRSYTRRIRSIKHLGGLARKPIRILSKPPTAESLFPNLRSLRCLYTLEAIHLLLVPLPSLISLHVEFMHCHFLNDPRLLQNCLKLLARLSANLEKLCIDVHTVQPMGVHTLIHLSRFPLLTQLSFEASDTLLDQITPSESPLFFPTLYKLILSSEFEVLDTISRLLSQTRLPAIGDLTAFIGPCPSERDISSFFTSLRTSVTAHTIQKLRLEQGVPPHDDYVAKDPRPVLGFEDLQPCVVFTNLRSIDVALDCRVDLTDSELLALASAWPHLECLLINTCWGWNTQGGITPNGLMHLLQKCQSLSWIGTAIDTRGYIEVPRSQARQASLLPRPLFIDVADSNIEAESVPAIAAFFAGIMSPSSVFRAWAGWGMEEFPNRGVCKMRWNDVHIRIMHSILQRS